MVSLEAMPIATWSKPTGRSSPTNSRQECSFMISPIKCETKKLSDALHKGGRLTADLHVEAKALHFLDQHVEGFGRSRFERIVALDDGFVDPGPTLHVVGFHRQQF